jgi:hypothetical protein
MGTPEGVPFSVFPTRYTLRGWEDVGVSLLPADAAAVGLHGLGRGRDDGFAVVVHDAVGSEVADGLLYVVTVQLSVEDGHAGAGLAGRSCQGADDCHVNVRRPLCSVVAVVDADEVVLVDDAVVDTLVEIIRQVAVQFLDGKTLDVAQVESNGVGGGATGSKGAVGRCHY